MLFRSTRNREDVVQASQAIVRGLSLDGGLYVPQEIPKLDISIEELAEKNYMEIAYEVMKLYLTDFTEEELKMCIHNAYSQGFAADDVVDIRALKDSDNESYILELYHGRTLAFKDVALSILPHLLVTAAKKNNISDELVILTATSGDTGKAALEGFKDVEGTQIVVFYPKDGVSNFQEKQMLTQQGKNVSIVGINGNFDDAQTGIKRVLNNNVFKKELIKYKKKITSANSINIGRLVPQIVYYVYTYSRLFKNQEIKKGEKINVVVPTGNFGNILAAYYAKNMGMPFDKIICASNKNNVLYDFFNSGTYNINRNFYVTTSPSMDILISSNLERFIDVVTGGNTNLNSSYMQELEKNGIYKIDKLLKDKLSSILGYYSDIEETNYEIKKIYDEFSYIVDPHTAVAISVYEKYVKDTKDVTKTVIASTASPYKFVETVLLALGDDKALIRDVRDNMEELEKIIGEKKPKVIEAILDADILHNTVIEVEDMIGYLEKKLFRL